MGEKDNLMRLFDLKQEKLFYVVRMLYPDLW
jgi:hypothetical protein